MGVVLGDRRKILRAIARLDDAEKAAQKPAAWAEATSAVRPRDAAERRQVTVMFSDLVGSTALFASMDLEDLREVISAYQKCVAETVQRFGGFVAKYMGDGVLVYFGYPQAHEDDAERAVRAGLEVIQAVRRWEQAKRGDGCAVLISGEAGIGKSRIAQTIVERLGGEPHTRLRYFCSPHHQDSALYPSIAQLERAAGFRREDTADQRLAKLEAVLLKGTNHLRKAVPLLADLLSIPTGERYPPLDLSPQKRKEKTLDAQMAQLEGLAARQPVLMVWEDMHWSDPTTRESLDLLVDRVLTLRVLMILTFRPEFTPPWIGRPHVTMLTLNRLPLRQAADIVAHVTGGKALPKEISDQIVDRTDGVPLFIEELTKERGGKRHCHRGKRPLRPCGTDGSAGDPEFPACIAAGAPGWSRPDPRGGPDWRCAWPVVFL